MISRYNDKEYMYIINDILNNKEFKKLDNLVHHGLTRMEHSQKVSYLSYKISKTLRLNTIATARAGLLHDFFFEQSNNNIEKIKYYYMHPKFAVNNASRHFKLSELEKDIIEKHMFPFGAPPKYMESWVVKTADSIISLGELGNRYGYVFRLKFRNAAVLFALFFSSVIRM